MAGFRVEISQAVATSQNSLVKQVVNKHFLATTFDAMLLKPTPFITA